MVVVLGHDAMLSTDNSKSCGEQGHGLSIRNQNAAFLETNRPGGGFRGLGPIEPIY